LLALVFQTPVNFLLRQHPDLGPCFFRCFIVNRNMDIHDLKKIQGHEVSDFDLANIVIQSEKGPVLALCELVEGFVFKEGKYEGSSFGSSCFVKDVGGNI
jgi:hypothetical protein